MQSVLGFRLTSLLLIGFLVCSSPGLFAQGKQSKKDKSDNEKTEAPKTGFDTVSLSGLKFRSVGPAITSGRISEIAVDPVNPKRYIVAVSSGGVWLTENSGVTFKPVFDGEGSYSIGTVVLDPGNPNVVWVGTGENNNQRSVAYGDGIYKSVDGGHTWKNMGLKSSEHIARIIVHPDNSNIIWAASMGPLWAPGGERGVYKSKDGGVTWEQVLKIDEHTGVSDLIMDPRNPDVLYAASQQRRRHVFTYIGGGPNSTIYKSTDGGMTWEKSAQGLPKGEIGRIGLAISPADPEKLYAIVEASGDKGGTYRSTNRGASWSKMGGYATSGNYYQEIIPDPKNPDRLYAMDTWMKVTDDGGKNWRNVGEDYKHVDNHSLWIDPNDTDHLLAGCDGGIYETWDQGKTWDFKANLPVTQFYKVTVGNEEPFYYIYGGTQDNFSMGGPSRTISGNGISNEQWFMTHGGDGFESQVDPFNPDIVYAQSQYGVLVRYDKKSGEEVGIQPHEREGENGYRWNWDAPLVASPHQEGRIYFAANKLFVSEDRGNNWAVISDDLTRQIDRNKLKVMGRVWSMDAVEKNQSTSQYGNIVAFAESPVNQDLLFVGTDDGLIQITTDRGKTWRKVDNIPGAPDTSYVNMLTASTHDENVVYACFNHHKYGDFKPYVFVSRDKGQTWTSISANLPERGSVYAIAEDHVDPNLLFVGTEFTFHFSNNGGKSWRKLANGLPTIAVRDIAIQQRENDIVLGTFGRGFYVLDDYTPLRQISEDQLKQDAMMFPVRDALSFEYSYPLGLPKKGFQGDNYYLGDNLGPEALITYYVKTPIKSLKDQRIKAEESLAKDGKDNAYPSYETLVAERDEEKAAYYVVIRNSADEIIRKLSGSADKSGVIRISWDLRTAHKNPARAGGSGFYNPFAGVEEGPQVAPGTYTAELQLWQNGEMKNVGNKVSFNVKSLGHQALPANDLAAMVEFKREVEELNRVRQTVSSALGEVSSELGLMRQAVSRMETPEGDWLKRIVSLEDQVSTLRRELGGDPLKTQLDMDPTPSVSSRIGRVMYESKYSTSAPTGTHKASIAIAEKGLANVVAKTRKLLKEDMARMREELQKAGAPYTPNAIPVLND